MEDTLIRDVSDTAFWIASYRAAESRRRDALFSDPLAARLAGERGVRIAASMPQSALTGWSVVMRTVIIDDFIRVAVARGVDTVLNLGAGLDTRPYRMDLPASLLWVEADHGHVIGYKEKQLQGARPTCRLERTGIDLSDAADRKAFLSSVDARAGNLLVLTEGVVPYLSIDEAADLADDLRMLQRATGWIVDYFSAELMKNRMRNSRVLRRMRNAPFKFMPTDWFGFFEEHGWRAGEVRYLRDESRRLRRPIPLPWFLKLGSAAWTVFASPEQRKAMHHFAGYVLLEPRSIPSG